MHEKDVTGKLMTPFDGLLLSFSFDFSYDIAVKSMTIRAMTDVME